MPSIIEQIQRDALDRNVAVSDLLRRVKLAAVKLGLDVVEDWVEKELNGYPQLPLPEYRVVYGTPMARHPYRGWEPIGGHIEQLSVRHVGQSIASLEELAKAPDGATIHFPISDSVVQQLNESNGVAGWPAVIEMDRSKIISILDRVRTLVLDWALKMEQAGVVGTGFNFDMTEKAKAQGATTMINIGTIGAFAGNLGSGNTAGDLTMRDLDLNRVGDIVRQLGPHVDALAAEGAEGPTLKARLDQLNEELRKPMPARSVLRGLLVDVRNSISGAAGNLIATGATGVINQLLGLGTPPSLGV